MQKHAPKDEAELAAVIDGGTSFSIEGRGSKAGLGRYTPCDTLLSLKHFSGVHIYEPEELILEAGAATPLQDIQTLLEKHQQMLAFEPPDHSHVWGFTSRGSIGGVLAASLAGPRRVKAGSARDHVLGVRGVTGRGEIFNAGARVVKNVTGYDMPKLMAGSFGTLAALSRVTFKVLPAPETEETIVIRGLDEPSAIVAMATALQSACDVSAAAHVPGQGTYLRFEGIAVSVASRRDMFVRSLQNSCEIADVVSSRTLWSGIRNLSVLKHDVTRALWRISVPPSDGARVAQRVAAQCEARYFFDWAGGLIWLSVPALHDGGAALVRAAVETGHATLYAAPEALRKSVQVFQPQSPAVATLTGRVKAALDPLAKLNFGRMYEGV
jgi:glycolate oxidase FAD binding subunit